MSQLDESLKELLSKEPHEFQTEEELIEAISNCRKKRATIGRDRQLKAAGARLSTKSGKAKTKVTTAEVKDSFDSLEKMIQAELEKKEQN